MAKLKINTDKKVTKEQISKHKDFKKFLKGYKGFYGYQSTRLLYKKRRTLTLVVVIVILVIILLFDKLG